MRAHRISKKQVRDAVLEAYNAQLQEDHARKNEYRRGIGVKPILHLIQHQDLPPEMVAVVNTLVHAFNTANGYNGKTTGKG